MYMGLWGWSSGFIIIGMDQRSNFWYGIQSCLDSYWLIIVESSAFALASSWRSCVYSFGLPGMPSLDISIFKTRTIESIK